MIFNLFTKKWKWSYGRYTHCGMRVLSKTKKMTSSKNASFSQQKQPRLEGWFFQKSKESIDLFNAFRSTQPIRIQPNNQKPLKEIQSTAKKQFVRTQDFAYFLLFVCSWSRCETQQPSPPKLAWVPADPLPRSLPPLYTMTGPAPYFCCVHREQPIGNVMSPPPIIAIWCIYIYMYIYICMCIYI